MDNTTSMNEILKSSERCLNIAVDIDGVLTKETQGHGHEQYLLRTPDKEMIYAITCLRERGHHIILFSARHEEDREITCRWLKDHGVQYDQLILGKPHYDIFIDDLSVNSLTELLLAVREKLI